ncbi:MAG: hypothetical protein ACLS36_01020 [Streptococcus sp.]
MEASGKTIIICEDWRNGKLSTLTVQTSKRGSDYVLSDGKLYFTVNDKVPSFQLP